jgi:hypothetical protein
MDRQALPSPYPDLADVRKDLDAWRRTRPRPRTIPEEFWSEAVTLRRTHPVGRVARALALDYYGLKRRCQDHGLEEFSFVGMAPWGQNAPVAELEDEDVSGRKLRLRCRADLSHVAQWIQCLGGLGP